MFFYTISFFHNELLLKLSLVRQKPLLGPHYNDTQITIFIVREALLALTPIWIGI